jgi:hypothetical protein
MSKTAKEMAVDQGGRPLSPHCAKFQNLAQNLHSETRNRRKTSISQQSEAQFHEKDRSGHQTIQTG